MSVVPILLLCSLALVAGSIVLFPEDAEGPASDLHEAELVLKSRRVVPGRLLRSGFVYDFPRWDEAAFDLCRRWRQRREALRARPRATPEDHR